MRGVMRHIFSNYFMQDCQNFNHVVLLAESSGNITGDDGIQCSLHDLVLTCSTNAYEPRCHYRKVSIRNNYLIVLTHLFDLPCSNLI